MDDETGLAVVTGRLDNLYVRYHPAGVLGVNGSLPVYLKDSNVETTLRYEIREAARHLASRLGFDPHRARVYRMDLAATMEMPRPVAEYLPVLSAPPRFTTTIHPGETVTFSTKSRSLSFYNKGRTTGVSGNLLRFEVKLKKRLKERFHRAVVLSDLYDAEFFALMVECWKDAYALVRKLRRPVLLPVSTPRQLERELARAGLQAAGGEQAVTGIVGGWDLGRSVYPLRRCIRELAGSGASHADVDLIEELDAAIERAARRALGDAGGSISLDL